MTENHALYDGRGFLLCCSPGVNSRSARVLFLLVAPGHLVFLYTIHLMRAGHTTLTYIFIAVYLTAALLQVRALIPPSSCSAVCGVGVGVGVVVTLSLVFPAGDDPAVSG